MPNTTASTRDTTMPDGPWRFDSEVTAAFDDMLARSIPQYEVMRGLVAALADRYLPDGGRLLDLGCSRGEALATVRDRVGPDRGVRYFGVEVSPPMLDACRARFADADDVTIYEGDLRRWYPTPPGGGGYHVTLAVLTLQFVPIEHRPALLRRMFEHTVPGGCAIVVEKVLGAAPELDELLVDVYLEHKRRQGYSQEQIDRKRLALEGVLVPVTSEWNVDLLRAAGFTAVDCVWRWSNFAGWIAVKGGRQ